MKKIYAYTSVCGRPAALHIFENKEALVSFAMNSGRGEATEGNPTIDKLLNSIGMIRIHAKDLNKYKLNSQYHCN
ncbi:MAG: hypothetical protein ACOX8A_12490 [Thermacetogeniaceae bacterium]|jgi:hypothetical protein